MIPYKSKVPGEASIRTKTYVLKFAIRKIISLRPTYSTAHHDHPTTPDYSDQARKEKKKSSIQDLGWSFAQRKTIMKNSLQSGDA